MVVNFPLIWMIGLASNDPGLLPLKRRRAVRIVGPISRCPPRTDSCSPFGAENGSSVIPHHPVIAPCCYLQAHSYCQVFAINLAVYLAVGFGLAGWLGTFGQGRSRYEAIKSLARWQQSIRTCRSRLSSSLAWPIQQRHLQRGAVAETAGAVIVGLHAGQIGGGAGLVAVRAG